METGLGKFAGRLALAPALILVLVLAGCTGHDGASSGVEGTEATAGPPWFEEASAARGIDFVHRSGHDGKHLFPEIIGGGAALFDMDGDGDLDAYLVQSGDLAAGPQESSANRLFENDGSGHFRDVTDGSGTGDTGYGMGVTTGDYDNDGDVDLYVTNYGPNVLLRNEGAGRFVDVTGLAGVGDPSWSTSTSFLDYDADGDLDLFVANYVHWTPGAEQDCYNPSGTLDYCLPTNYNAPATDRLYRNDGNGSFTDVTVAAGLQTAFGNGLGVVAADFDSDGRLDIFVANDTMMNQLWMQFEPGRFRDQALLRGCALDEHGVAKAGMGVASADLDGDGDPELMVVNLQGQSDSFFRNDDGYFTDRTGAFGLAASSRRFTRFGVGLHDLDSDGVLDLYEANGRVVKSSEPTVVDPFAEANSLFRGTPEGFAEVDPRGGTSTPLVATSRAAAFGDVDGDGGVDVLVANRDGRAHLFHNIVEPRGHWSIVRGVDQGRDAIGAAVFAEIAGRRVRRDLRAGSSYCAASDPRAHFGLGQVDRIDSFEVRWVDGVTERFPGVDADQIVTLRRGEGRPE